MYLLQTTNRGCNNILQKAINFYAHPSLEFLGSDGVHVAGEEITTDGDGAVLG